MQNILKLLPHAIVGPSAVRRCQVASKPHTTLPNQDLYRVLWMWVCIYMLTIPTAALPPQFYYASTYATLCAVPCRATTQPTAISHGPWASTQRLVSIKVWVSSFGLHMLTLCRERCALCYVCASVSYLHAFVNVNNDCNDYDDDHSIQHCCFRRRSFPLYHK